MAMVGMLSYLQGYTQPEISMAVHRSAKYFNNPRLVHKRTIRCITKNLVSKSTYVDLTDSNCLLSTSGIV